MAPGVNGPFRDSATESAARIVDRALLSLLRGAAPPILSFAVPERELEERADAGDAEARVLLRARAHLAELPSRVTQALELERAPVVLADGSSLSLDDAERLLARKEERQAHVALRGSIAQALRPFRAGHAIRHFHARGNDGLSPFRAFLSSTSSLRDAAREALTTLGGEALDRPTSLARALDLPDDTGAFGEASTTSLLATARDACRPAHRVGRFRAPRLLAGVVLTLGPDREREVRFAQPSVVLRFDRHMRTLDAGCRALCGGDDVLARGMALGLSSSFVRRSLGASRADAERAGRIGSAVALLEARARAALAVLGAEAWNSDGAREALIDAWGADPGPDLVDDRLRPAWTLREEAQRDEEIDDVVAAARAFLDGFSAALALRDAFDETFPLRPEAWREGASVVASARPQPVARTSDGERNNDNARRWTAGVSGWVGDQL